MSGNTTWATRLHIAMWLEQDVVDLLEVDDFGSIADGLEQRAETQVLGAT